MRRFYWHSDRGSASAELVLLAGLVLMFALACVGFGRLALANMTVQSAVSAAAREASLARTDSEAQTSAHDTANAALNSSGIYCRALTVTVDTSGMNVPLGQVGMVSSTITCDVELSDIALPGLPGSKQMTATASSPVDPYRERR